ncbi:sensor histidine kinase/response regulator, putative [Talaromyces stipitatus ATCC 10500]|uniref:histidine kinase n=1 Tax=Talaromyces stipitatus (strain ATCC 10500 / CBS 375.48 / QM 6759 / NRRL 1006) TaxID=441959 RepID=B8M7Y0_TALSN|nr:sensor histidine kinase/response regulator, putative [Talaromyces stipitatus ATCC 10500]EED19859.1 sensor histidine kinase/response regulator, putative [Talaromyces stipitatus ATCC 10500]
MRRNPARLTPTKAPSPSAGPPSHSRNSSRTESLLHITATISETSPTQDGTFDPLSDAAADASYTAQSNARRLEELKRQMEQTLMNQQAQHHHHHHKSPKAGTGTERSRSPTRMQIPSPGSGPRTAISSKPQSPFDAPPHTGSNGSATTVKGLPGRTPDIHVPKTPSYPFPLMPALRNQHATTNGQLQSDAAAQNASSRMKEKSKSKRTASKAPGTIDMSSPPKIKSGSHMSFYLPESANISEDPMYPSPNLYNVILKLNSEPGLEAWWKNVIDILQTHYGMERASLAVPGDPTDLENVPWGQKASFNPNELFDVADPTASSSDALTAFNEGAVQEEEEKDDASSKREDLGNTPTQKKHSSSKRPSLLARHSFAGFTRDRKSVGTPSISGTPAKSTYEVSPTVSSIGYPTSSGAESPPSSTFVSQDNDMKLGLGPGEPPAPRASSSMAVFTIPRDLEAENQPLVKSTGIVKLFGRNKPAVLTREYAYDPAAPSSFEADVTAAVQSPSDVLQATPASEPSPSIRPEPIKVDKDHNVIPPPQTQGSRVKSSALNPHVLSHKKDSPGQHAFPLYEEYEQVPSSPWSQSPAPSPAPRVNPEQNPFFMNHAVDETAFAQDPPPHDYAQAQPVAAIGVDRSKSVVHVPLIYAGNTQELTSETVRFPVAVLSFLSPVVPYPANLRSSLLYLMPHLTSSYSLAHQYSQLERQLVPGVYKPRFGHLLGLGGTFSDASSELELVAGLSGQAMTDGGSMSARASVSSPDEVSNASKFSPSLSIVGTPAIDNVSTGPASEPGTTPAIGQNVDQSDGYFNLHQVRNSAAPLTARSRGSRSRQNLYPSIPVSPSIARSKSVREEDWLGRDSRTTDQSHDSGRPTPASAPTRSSSRNASTTSVIAQLQREGVSISEHIFQLMLNSVPLHLFLAKASSGEVLWTNSKFDAYRRSHPQEQSIRDPWQNVHPEEVESLSKQWHKALQTGSQFTERVRVKRFNDDNAYRWFIFRANPLLSQTGQVVSWIGSFLDIHEQHVSELRAAQERETFATNAKYRALANSIPQIVFEATELRGLISANEQWHLYTGQSIEEAMNYGFTAYIHPDDLEKCGILSSEIFRGRTSSDVASKHPDVGPLKLFANGVTPGLIELVNQGIVNSQQDENGRIFYTTELRIRSKGGGYRWHLVRLVKVETSNFGDDEASWYGTCTDINDRKLLERELNKAMQKLNREMESKTKFFSNMSHEIRTPLNGILGTIPFILDTTLDHEQRRMLDTIQNSSTNLRELVDNILDVSRVEAGKMNMVKSWFHLRSVLEDVIDTVAPRAIDKGLEINYLMDTDVPDMVIGDRFRIRQVLINLMGNAVKFTPHGEIYTRCSVYREPGVPLRDTELLLNFEVVDTGKGFSNTDAQRLMQRFSQLGGNGSQQNAGSGLGLFLSKQLVEMHGGKLTPSSREGQGAKFSFYIKVDAPPQVPEPPLTRRSSDMSEAATAASQGSSQLRIPLHSTNSTDSKIFSLQDLSPALDMSPLTELSGSPDPSIRSGFHYRTGSSVSSAVATPDSLAPSELGPKIRPSPLAQDFSSADTNESNETLVQSTPTIEKALGPSYLRPVIYSVLIICPLDHARDAVKQHIEQVIPLEVPATSTALADLDDWKDLRETSSSVTFSHVVLDFPGGDEIMEALQYVLTSDMKTKPSIVIICDLYQKRQISGKIEELISAEFRVDTVPKPVKPSAFSRIFDPDNRRDLSKDRNQDMAREVNNNFKTMSKMVKEVIGNKGYRILLVEDDETNRMVMLKYLDKVKVVSETASNGQECLDMVLSHEPGYYSLIICDIQMPIKNGYETCREIREWEAKNHFHQIPIMALSANAMTDQIDDAARAGFNDYVTKPIKHNELGKMMMNLLDPNTPGTLLRDRKDWRQQKA